MLIEESVLVGEPARERGNRPFHELIAASEGRQVRLIKLPLADTYLNNGRRVARKGPADFMGLCRSNLRLIVFNTAESGNRWSLPLDERSLPEWQRRVLMDYGDDGAVAGLLVAATHQQVQMAFWVPWNALVQPAPMMTWTDDRIHELGPLTELINFGTIPGVR